MKKLIIILTIVLLGCIPYESREKTRTVIILYDNMHIDTLQITSVDKPYLWMRDNRGYVTADGKMITVGVRRIISIE